MPLVRISLLKGKSPSYIRAISNGIHRALTEIYNVPASDRFQLIHQHERDDFVYDTDYLGIHRTDDVIFIQITFIQITAGNWRTKRALYRRLAELLAEQPGLRPEDVQVIVSPNARDEWSLWKGLASYLKDPDPA